jgi:hypothetical protein
MSTKPAREVLIDWPEQEPSGDVDLMSFDNTPRLHRYNHASLTAYGMSVMLDRGKHKGRTFLEIATDDATYAMNLKSDHCVYKHYKQWYRWWSERGASEAASSKAGLRGSKKNLMSLTHEITLQTRQDTPPAESPAQEPAEMPAEPMEEACM